MPGVAVRYEGTREHTEAGRIRETTVLAWRTKDKAEELTPDLSLKHRNHSPSGFEWGYSGSGPAQLALAILLDYFGAGRRHQGQEKALCLYQRFKDAFIAPIRQPTWTITAEQIDAWVITMQKEAQT